MPPNLIIFSERFFIISSFFWIDKSDNLDKLYQSLKEKGDSVIKISIYETGKNYLFQLKDKRKFNYETYKNLNKERFIKKISV